MHRRGFGDVMRSGQIAARAAAVAGVSLLLGIASCFYAFRGFLTSEAPPGTRTAGVLAFVFAFAFAVSLVVAIAYGIRARLRPKP